MADDKVQEEEMTNNSANAEEEKKGDKSALQDNIERKGKNAYYFAHAHRANGPDWDGNMEPRLLGRTESTASSTTGAGGGAEDVRRSALSASFDARRSTITNYAFLDEEERVRIYVTIPEVATKYPGEEDIKLEHTTDSFELTLWKTSEEDGGSRSCEGCLAFCRLFGPIEAASFRKKKDKIVLTLKKSEQVEWTSIGK